ncbi:MAG: ABC transporter substrate-binding protein [Pseudomonadota bacterium]|nr:ABC transporter substrate-binding protein [Pseudomonadota bacterium]
MRSCALLLVLLVGSLIQAEDGAEKQATQQNEPRSLAADDRAGIYADKIVVGQSAALSGVAKELGISMRRGLLAAFDEVNGKGGVFNRKIELITLDDGYEPEQTIKNMHELISKHKVFTLVGGVGTPTSKAALPIISKTPLLYVGPFTGASFLRSSYLNTVVNVRASYAQETLAMVERLRKDLKISRVAVLYQNDSYGLDGLRGVQKAVEVVKGIKLVSTGSYQRNTTAVKTALLDIRRGNPQAVIAIGSYLPIAAFIKWARKMRMYSTVFLAVSFVGVNPLAAELRYNRSHVFVTQVVPPPTDKKVKLVETYLAALKSLDAKAKPGFGSMEGYVVGRLVIEALQRAGAEVNFKTFLAEFKKADTVFDIDGFRLAYGEHDNQGSDNVFITRIYRGKIRPLKKLTLVRARKKQATNPKTEQKKGK